MDRLSGTVGRHLRHRVSLTNLPCSRVALSLTDRRSGPGIYRGFVIVALQERSPPDFKLRP